MFYLSPFTWLIESMMGNFIHDKVVRCLPDELNDVPTPPGTSCEQHMDFTVSLSRADQSPWTARFLALAITLLDKMDHANFARCAKVRTTCLASS